MQDTGNRMLDLLGEIVGEMTREEQQTGKALAVVGKRVKALEYKLEEYTIAARQNVELMKKIGYDDLCQLIRNYPLDDADEEKRLVALVLEKWNEFLKSNPDAGVLKRLVINRIWADFRAEFKTCRIASLPRLVKEEAFNWLVNYRVKSIGEYGPLATSILKTCIANGHTLTAAAADMGCSFATVCHWVSGLALPNADSTVALAWYLGRPVLEVEALAINQAKMEHKGHDRENDLAYPAAQTAVGAREIYL